MPTARTCPSCHTSLPDEAQFCMQCGKATPTEPGVPPRTMPTGEFEVAKVTRVLASRYRIERVIGEGGMATVYLAEDLKHKRQVAVKVMRPELAATLGTDRFLREVEIAAQLNHPNILPMHDSGDADGVLYYVMPFVEGESLAARLQREGELPVPVALRIGREVAEALAYAHKRGVIHRDIKPANILLHEGHALVADFGIARALDAEGEAITKTGLAIGTPQYMSPEQSTGDKTVDARTDIYALGAVLYEMITGEPPFTGRTSQAVVARSLTERPRPLAATREGLPTGLEETVGKALARSAADRYASAMALAESLSRLEMSGSHASIPFSQAIPAQADAASSPTLWIALGVIALLALGAVAFMAGRWGLPSWVLGVAVALLVAGGVMLILTTAAEQRRHSGAPPKAMDGPLTWRSAGLGGIGAVIAWALVAGAASAGRSPASARSAGVTHVAVLPFQNQGDSANNYIVDGITDEVRGKLSQVSGLAVIASGSSSQYRGTTKTPREIAGELGAQYLLVGRVRWAPGATAASRRVQVVAELENGETGATTWQQTFDADLTDVFAIQSQMAQRVAGALGTELGAKETEDLAKRPTQNAAAWDAYLRGKAVTGNDPASLRLAVASYEQAVALDSNFAEAWARLSSAEGNLYFNGSRDPGALMRSLEAATRAIAVARENAAGYAALGSYYATVSPDPVKSAGFYETALRLSPNDPVILRSAAGADASLGNTAQSVARLEKLRELDPRSASVLRSLADGYVRTGRPTEAADAIVAAMALEPAPVGSYETLAIARASTGDLAGAQDAARQGAAALSSPVVAGYFAGFNEMSWVLDSATEALVFRLQPSAFDGDRAWWGQSLATANWMRGRKDLARAYADSALALSRAQTDAVPTDPSPRMLYALMLAYVGRADEAEAQGRRSIELSAATPRSNPAVYNQLQMARLYLVLDKPGLAMDQLDTLLTLPTFVSRKWLTIDPTFASLKGNARFERMVAGS
jgi:serine/threonine-protein kinase